MLVAMSGEAISERMAAAARELQDQFDPQATMESAVALAARNVEGCDAAGVAIVHAKRRVDTPAGDDMAVTCDQLQYEVGQGPCLDAIWEDETVYSPDLATDSRWPRWGPRVTEETGLRSIFSIRLFTLKDTIGALNLYSTTGDGFDAEDKVEGIALGAHVAMAVAAARSIGELEAALDSRTVIGQACGIVMERFTIDAARAFALLTRISSTHNVKLRDVAAEIIATRQLPVPPQDPAHRTR